MRRRGLWICCGALAALSAVTALALASLHTAARPVSVRPAAAYAASSGRCVARTLNRSAVLPGTSLAVSPLPGSYAASSRSQVSLLGAPLQAISSVRVSGSRTGSHRGRLRGFSQGDGASFVPSRPFAAGETVTVGGNVKVGSRTQRFAYSFAVARQDVLPYSAPHVPSGRDPNEVQHFHSRADLQPPSLVVSARSPQTAPGYIFASPYAGPGKPGPEIFDDAGNLVWFDPMPAGTEATNLQVQQYGGKAVLTWWQGYIPKQGFGQGDDVIADSSYRQIGRVHAGNGYKADLHEFKITPAGTALISIFNPVACDLSASGGPRDGAVTDTGFQEVDIRTGLVRREWHSLDHVALGDSDMPAHGTSREWPFDYFHFNSIDQRPDGTTLISARNTSALYELSTLTGQIVTRMGGKHSDLKLGSGAATAFQHDAKALANGTTSIFDNGATPKVHAQSRGLLVNVSAAARTETVVAQYVHPAPLSAASQGNLQILENGDAFIGWGSEPYFSEFSAGGQLRFDAHMHGSYQSYRAYRFPWTGAPSEPPAVAAVTSRAGAPATVYASWNGDTRTASWRLLTGPSANQLAGVATAPRAGFETAITAPGPAPYVAVQALDASGAVLGTSRTIAG
jgi:hypothetical protein